jgi:hypothetical protein
VTPAWPQEGLDAMHAALAEAEMGFGEGEIIATGRNCSVANSDNT